MRKRIFLQVMLLAGVFCSCGNLTGGSKIPNHVIFHPEIRVSNGLVFLGDTMLACTISEWHKYPGAWHVVPFDGPIAKPSNVFFVKGEKIIEAQRNTNHFFSDLTYGSHVANIKMLDDGAIRIEPAMPFDKAIKIRGKMVAKRNEAEEKGEEYKMSDKERQAYTILDVFSAAGPLYDLTYFPQDTNAPKMHFDISEKDDDVYVTYEKRDVYVTYEKRIDYSGTYQASDELTDAVFKINKDGTWRASGTMGYHGSICKIDFSGKVDKDGQLIVEKGTYEDIENAVITTLPQGFIFGTCKDSKIEYRDGEVVDYIHKNEFYERN